MTVESKEGRGGRWWRHKGKMGRIRWWKGKRIVKVGDIAFRTVWGPGKISLWHLHYPKNMGGVGAKKGISIIQCLTFFPQLALPSPTFFLENLFLYCIAIYIGCSGKCFSDEALALHVRPLLHSSVLPHTQNKILTISNTTRNSEPYCNQVYTHTAASSIKSKTSTITKMFVSSKLN